MVAVGSWTTILDKFEKHQISRIEFFKMVFRAAENFESDPGSANYE